MGEPPLEPDPCLLLLGASVAAMVGCQITLCACEAMISTEKEDFSINRVVFLGKFSPEAAAKTTPGLHYLINSV